jgi:cyclopropane fatty-acyl-phospholipid synthase-like methyltransferase
MQNNNSFIYGKLCSLYYDIKEKYASSYEVDFYAAFIEPGQRVLEAMSGSGRLQIPLLQRGYMVDGVDSSASMLERCRQRCVLLKLTPRLYEQRLEELALEQKYNTVIIAMGSFQLIADRALALQALQKLRAHMFDGGNLLIDIFVPDVTAHNKRSTSDARIDDHQLIRFSTRYIFHEQEQRVDALCSYELLVDGVVQEREDELMHFVWYTDNELVQLLDQAGFDMVCIYEKEFRAAGVTRIVHAKARLVDSLDH